MFQPGPILVNGKKCSSSKASQLVSIFSPSFQYGLNVFEGIRFYKNSKHIYPFLYKEHIERLLESCKLIGFEKYPSYEEVESDILMLIKTKVIDIDVYIKYIVGYLGEGSWYSRHKPDRICFYYKSNSILRLENPTFKKAKFTSIKRISHNNFPPKIKCGANYINSRFGFLEINNLSVNNEKFLPIFFDENGFISESSGSTLFLIKDKEILTPSLENSILNSITRSHLIKLLSEKLIGYNITERNIDRWEIYSARGIFTVGTSIEIAFISEIDHIKYDLNLKIINDIFSIFKKEIFCH